MEHRIHVVEDVFLRDRVVAIVRAEFPECPVSDVVHAFTGFVAIEGNPNCRISRKCGNIWNILTSN
jgi:hypothetical protein